MIQMCWMMQICVGGAADKLCLCVHALQTPPVYEGDIYPGTTLSQRQPIKEVQDGQLDRLLDQPNKNISVVYITSMMQTFKTCTQTILNLYELSRGKLVINFMGKDNSGLLVPHHNKFQKVLGLAARAAGIDAAFTPQCYLISSAATSKNTRDLMKQAIASYRKGIPVIIFALANENQLTKINDLLYSKEDQLLVANPIREVTKDKVVVFMDEAHSFFGPNSQKVAAMKTLVL